MKNQKYKKYINILTIFILIIMFLSPAIFSSDINVNNFKPGNITDSNLIVDKAKLILGYVQIIGSVMAVIIISVIGIKYIYGSVEEKAEYKKTMIPYLIGAVFLFASSNLVQIIYDIMKTINDI